MIDFNQPPMHDQEELKAMFRRYDRLAADYILDELLLDPRRAVLEGED